MSLEQWAKFGKARVPVIGSHSTPVDDEAIRLELNDLSLISAHEPRTWQLEALDDLQLDSRRPELQGETLLDPRQRRMLLSGRKSALHAQPKRRKDIEIDNRGGELHA